jgi:hypothetical protein
MIYGHVTGWMAKENPDFAQAVAKYYSIRNGQKNSAAFGEMAYWQMAETLLSRAPSDPSKWSQEEYSFYQPLLLRVENQIRQVRQAVRAGDYKYLRKLAACVHLLQKRHNKSGREPLGAIEYIFESYCFLRRRAGEGSELPVKREVTKYAALFQAFDVLKLMSKLPKFLWDLTPTRKKKMPGTALTDQEFNEVKRLQQHYLRPETKPIWTYRLEKAGLGESLRQSSRE